jgi:N4-gp56 family major capsid protein|uniref:Major capsid protein n=1 Tax=Siphoviridae sp. ctwnj8 TaxID=2825734 RepID=A0A8S5U015_9CAUD|nr:MAG TPA: major capsid protein [Siphoviridae sp. ctwnj8]
MANQTTKIADLINPQVMADMISAKIQKKIVVAPFAKIDTTLVGVPGNTITVPKYGYIGDAEDVAEGVAAGTVKLSTGSTTVTVKKAMKAVELTDEAILSGYGNPVGETNNQLAKAVAAKVDNDAMDALQKATLIYDGSTAGISYNSIVDAIDLFDEEVNSEKVMFINPKQVTVLRKDTNFISADRYTGQVILTGEIGMIANCRIVPSKKVPVVKVGDSTKVDCYACPIVKLNNDAETEDDAAALTIYLKKDTSVETERNTLARLTDVSVDKHYAAALTNESKVVLAKFKK